jgi:hypothetical protein
MKGAVMLTPKTPGEWEAKSAGESGGSVVPSKMTPRESTIYGQAYRRTHPPGVRATVYPDDRDGEEEDRGDETERKAAPKDKKPKDKKKSGKKKSKKVIGVTAPVRKEKAMSLSKLRREARYEVAAVEAREERRAHRERDADPETQKALRLSGFESSESLHDALHVARAEAQEKHPTQPGRTGKTSFEKAVTGGMSLAEAKAFVEKARKAAKVV